MISSTFLYCNFWQLGCTQCTFCTAQRALCTVFPTFLSLKLESCNLVCRREFGFHEHSYTVFFGNYGAQGVYSAHTQRSAHCALISQLCLFFKIESCNLVCRLEFRFCNHSLTLSFDKQGVYSAHNHCTRAHCALFSQLFCFLS